jgi:uncharacterized protein (DUF4415 family)
MGRKPPSISDNTPEEEAAIQRQIAEDGETWEAGEQIGRRGRPRGRTKVQVTVSLDIDLVEALKLPDEKGWQTRLNQAARTGLGI